MAKRTFLIATISSICMLLLLILTGCSNGSTPEVSIPTVEENKYIYDNENIIDDTVQEQVNKILISLEKQTDVEFAVVTVESFNGLDIDYYANKLFNGLKLGKKGKDNGILLLISKQEHRSSIRDWSKHGAVFDSF